MRFDFDGCFIQDVENNEQVVNDIIHHVGHEYFDPKKISRAMGAYNEEGALCGYFLTCTFLGVRSFHGFKFIKGKLSTQFKMARKYIDIEELKYSGYRNKEADVMLRALGFTKIYSINGISVAKKE